ncbi:alanine racemase [Colwellia sp. D2M02]|uniref:alanine racemase n=1 Tax=Colwellia sp. D2M02 TaxID=2841562 RepID=UPI001C092672|nr:alanine racemase [Colwellia sp. D2M02]MBU2893381.1 alanine racemase [Colwellia sp. D2M02]
MRYISRDTQATIDLNALVENYQYVASIAPQSNTIAVVKADAYGHDANLVAHALSPHVELFAVGFIDEALALRQSGIKNNILILEGPFKVSDFTIAHEHNFLLMLHSDYQIDWLLSQQPQLTQNIWLKVDTGMNRLGFAIDDIDNIISKLDTTTQQNLVLCSHFSTSEQITSRKPVEQLARLKPLVEKYSCQFSMANSAGIFNFPASHGDYTRLGLALYGISPTDNNLLTEQLNPVMTLQAKIIAIHQVEIGETVGYGDTWSATRTSKIATVAIGYADGYPRNAKSGTPVFINGRVVPIVGRVSMDMITVDVTDLTVVTVGDSVELWGKHISIDSVAKSSDTINYELLTRVSKRVPKVAAS